MVKVNSSILALAATASAQTRGGSAFTKNEPTASNCAPLSLIFARGTSEIGDLGTVVGPPLAKALRKAYGAKNVAVQGAKYEASRNSAIKAALKPQDTDGAKAIAKQVAKVLVDCPSTKIVLAGYNQGAEMVHGTLYNLDKASPIAAVLTFGDPLHKETFVNIDATKVKVNCAKSDNICNGIPVVDLAHVAYGNRAYINANVQFVQKLIGELTGTTPGKTPIGGLPVTDPKNPIGSPLFPPKNTTDPLPSDPKGPLPGLPSDPVAAPTPKKPLSKFPTPAERRLRFQEFIDKLLGREGRDDKSTTPKQPATKPTTPKNPSSDPKLPGKGPNKTPSEEPLTGPTGPPAPPAAPETPVSDPTQQPPFQKEPPLDVEGDNDTNVDSSMETVV